MVTTDEIQRAQDAISDACTATERASRSAESAGVSMDIMALHLQSGLGESTLRASLVFAPAGAAFGLCGFYWRKLPARV